MREQIERRLDTVWIAPLADTAPDRLPRISLIGRDFDRLHVVSFAGHSRKPGCRNRQWWWWCRCSCGNPEPVRRI